MPSLLFEGAWARRGLISIGLPLAVLVFGLRGSTFGAELPFSSIFEIDRPSVVYIVAALPNGGASGSGFIYSSTGTTSTIITANHVVEGASRVDVILDSDPHERYPATIIKRDHIRDVAILSIAIGNRRALPLMDPSKVKEGSDMAVIGYPRAVKKFEEIYGDDLRPSVHVGIVSAVRLKGEIIQFDAQTDHGDSGGPVIDKATGAVIGIVTGILLDPAYSARGIEQALPGSNYGMSVATINQVLNGDGPVSSLATAERVSTSSTNSTSPTSADPSNGGGSRSTAASAAYRVGYGAPHYTNPEVEADSQLVLQRLANYFAGQNAFYMVPVQFGVASENGEKLSGLCDDNRLNAIVQPSVFWEFPRVYTATGAPAQILVKVNLIITDCSGGAFFYVSKTKTEDTRFTHRTVDRNVVDMANDLLDQTLQDFDSFRAAHQAAWDSLLRTGIAIDPNDGRYHAMFNWTLIPETHSYRVYAVFTNGPAAIGGLLVGDVIQSINGQSVGGLSNEQISQLFNSDKLTVVVSRPGGQATLFIQPKRYPDLVASLSR